jgi:hypothetical protein
MNHQIILILTTSSQVYKHHQANIFKYTTSHGSHHLPNHVIQKIHQVT